MSGRRRERNFKPRECSLAALCEVFMSVAVDAADESQSADQILIRVKHAPQLEIVIEQMCRPTGSHRIQHMWRKAVFVSGDCQGDCQVDCTAVRNSDYTLQGVRDSICALLGGPSLLLL